MLRLLHVYVGGVENVGYVSNVGKDVIVLVLREMIV